MMRAITVLALLLLAATPASPPTRYLVVWAVESKDPAKTTGRVYAMHPEMAIPYLGRDFLAVFNVTEGSDDYGHLVAMLPVGAHGQMAHHTNYEMPPDNVVFANDFMAAQSYVFDVHNPAKPTLTATFGEAGPYTHAHSFARLANGNTLATYQFKGAHDTAAGALVELDSHGHAIRASDAAAANVDSFIRPYSLQVVADLDRVVTTSADMMPNIQSSHVVQVWRLSDLKLLKTVLLPVPSGRDFLAKNADEARVLADGKTVLVATSGCGLYKINDLAGSDPTAQFVYDLGYRACAVPTVAGNYWVEATTSGHAVISLDVSNPTMPFEVGHVAFKGDAYPHWVSHERGGNRIAITGYGSIATQVYLATIDLGSGALSLDRKPIEFNREWPDGWNAGAIPHGALFSN